MEHDHAAEADPALPQLDRGRAPFPIEQTTVVLATTGPIQAEVYSPAEQMAPEKKNTCQEALRPPGGDRRPPPAGPSPGRG